jgi:hypothetical protein
MGVLFLDLALAKGINVLMFYHYEQVGFTQFLVKIN